MIAISKLTKPVLFQFCFLVLLAPPCASQRQKDYNDFPFQEFTVQQLQKGYRDGKFTIVEVVKAYLDRIEAIDKNGPAINSIIEINPDALKIAKALDQELKNGKIRGPMHGVPVLLKDNIDTHDKMSTTAGSRALAGSHPLQDSWVAKKLRDAGAIIIGKANMSEWANFRADFSSSGWSGIGGQTKNPYVLTRNPCGSSSGSGAAVSANLCILAIGTETNGSIVCPANNNGVVGIKPTVGLISRSGIIPISFTQDTPGPMARTVRDAAICLGVLTGIDSTDSKTLLSGGRSFQNYEQFLDNADLHGKRIGLDKEALGKHFRVDSLMNKAVQYFKDQGAEIIEIDNILENSVYEYSFQVMLYEFKDGLNKYFSSLGPGAPVKNLEELFQFNLHDSVELKYFDQKLIEQALEKGSLSDSVYKEALNQALRISREKGMDSVMNVHHLDAIIAPTGGPAWTTDLLNGDRFLLGSSSPAAISGYPNITVPMGFVDELPVGLSIFGRAWSEPLLLQIAYAYESGTHHRRAPKFLREN